MKRMYIPLQMSEKQPAQYSHVIDPNITWTTLRLRKDSIEWLINFLFSFERPATTDNTKNEENNSTSQVYTSWWYVLLCASVMRLWRFFQVWSVITIFATMQIRFGKKSKVTIFCLFWSFLRINCSTESKIEVTNWRLHWVFCCYIRLQSFAQAHIWMISAFLTIIIFPALKPNNDMHTNRISHSVRANVSSPLCA